MTDLDVRQTDEFREWLDRLRDERAKARIAARIRRLVLANPGDMKSLGGGLIEMRIDYGPGYRIYFTRRGPPHRPAVVRRRQKAASVAILQRRGQ